MNRPMKYVSISCCTLFNNMISTAYYSIIQYIKLIIRRLPIELFKIV